MADTEHPDADSENADPVDQNDRPDDTEDEEPFDRDRAMRTIRALREDVKKAKADSKRTADLERRLQEMEDANKTEEQRRLDRLAELEKAEQARAAELQKARLENAVLKHATRLDVTDPALAYRAIDPDTVEYDEHGAPSNIEAVLADVLDRHPALKAKTDDDREPKRTATASTDSGTGKTGGKGPSLTADELEAAKALGMTPERYAATKGKRTVAEIAAAVRQLNQT